MRGFAFTSAILLGCMAQTALVSVAQAKTAAGGILLLSFIPESEVNEENRFWRFLLGQMTECEARPNPVSDDGAITLGSGCHPAQVPQTTAPLPGEAGA